MNARKLTSTGGMTIHHFVVAAEQGGRMINYVIYRIHLRESQLLCVQKEFHLCSKEVSWKKMCRRSEVSLSPLLLHWLVVFALLFSSIGGIDAAPIPQSASELMADTEKWLSVGPGKTRDNAVFVVDDKDKLAFTLFRPECLENGGVQSKPASRSKMVAI
uniref:Uncharacterized protein n=1 Tax=Ditylenchus dipsaci TaxID=166011 RepID=A0A915E2K1_9BILA